MDKSVKFHKPHRLKKFDYSSACSYMLTFNTKNRDRILSEIVYKGMFDPPEICLTDFGKVTEKHILNIPNAYKNVTLDNYVIMPDHIHVLLTIERQENAGNKGVNRIIQTTKSMISREIGFLIWQKDFYDVVADTEEIFQRCDKYIDDNPAAWFEKHSEPASPK